jgi:putative membrane protein
VVVAAIFGILNFLLGWLLFAVLVVGTLGLGLLLSFLLHWVVNAILLKITDAFTSRLDIRSFGTALIAALVMSLLGRAGLYVADKVMHPHAAPGSVYII